MANETILVIEDEPDIQELIAINLNREGYRVQCFPSGEEGLAAARSVPPKLMLLDIMLPGIDGLDVCRSMKTYPQTSQVPIIFVSARGHEVDMVTGLEVGADDYVTKPLSPKVLVAKIKALLRRRTVPELGEVPPIKLHGLEIHPGRLEVLADGSRLEMSLTEFRILHFLAQNPGWVFTRYQIVSGVKGDDCIVTDRSVDVHIVGLRRRLGEFGKLIETVRGVGYRIKK